MNLIIESERILLREFEPSDAAQLHPVFSDPEANRHTVRVHTDVAQTLAWIEAIRVGYTRQGFAPWAVVRKEDQGLLGYCGCGVVKLDGRGECELGYRIIRSWWGQGFATEAALACIKRFRPETQFSRMVALIQPANVASVRVAEKVGMKYQGDTVYEHIPMRLHAIDLGHDENHRVDTGK